MRIPLDWLREFVPVPAEHRAEDVMADLVRVGLEEEDVHRPAAELQGPIVVGQVLSKEPEPQKNGKTINWCSVRVVPEGAAQPLTGEGIEPSGVQGIVCGAHNFEVGDKVVVTLPGAVLPGDFRISPRKTYGHVSAGMIASSTELGMGDDGTDGIIVLGDLGLDPEPGTDARDVLDLHGEAAEINVTPDRGYAFSMRGVAREYAHATGVPFTDPAAAVHPPAADDAGPAVRIDDDAPIHGEPGATRFVARTVSGVDATRPTPPWLAARLRLAGIRTISLPVDISNYVMWELGQPLHFYDADTLSGEIVVRRARAGETLTTLDGKERELDPEDLLIADDSGPIGLAGVMGGAATEVTDATTTIVVESANFDPVSIARTRRRHRLPSEASKRNERGVDWEIADEAAERAVQMLVELAGGTAEPGVTDVGTRPQPAVVEMAADFPSALVGVAYTTDEVVVTLRALGAEVTVAAAADGVAPRLTVTAPSWRTDLRIPEDLAEEVARLRGYDAIPSVVPVAPPGRGFTRRQAQRRRVSAALAAAGLTEVLAYPFVSEEQNRRFGADSDAQGQALAMVALANPIASQYRYLRLSLLPGLVETARRNLGRGFRDLALYEMGLVFLPGAQLGSATIPPRAVHPSAEVLADLEAGIPAQPWHVAGLYAGHDSAPGPDHDPRPVDWQDAIAGALDVADVLGVELTVRQGRHHAFHPGRVAELVVVTEHGDRVVGVAGELHPQWLEAEDLPARTSVWELDLDALCAAAPEIVVAAPLSTFPVSTQDVALVVDEAVVAGDVRATLAEGAGELLEAVELFDVYRGAGVPEGRKSLAFSLRFRAPDRTLTAEEVSEARAAATALAAQRHGAVQR